MDLSEVVDGSEMPVVEGGVLRLERGVLFL
jgi:hypothetical protein